MIKELGFAYMQNWGRERQIAVEVAYSDAPKDPDKRNASQGYDRETAAQLSYANLSRVPKTAHTFA
jgi:hypothetical protein